MKIILIDINQKMTNAWKNEFSSFHNIEVINDSIFNVKAQAMVSPANSFGIMDGGIDGKIRDFFGKELEKNVRKIINEEYGGELPVGSAIITNVQHKQFDYLIPAPTMRVPENVENTLNAYLAMRAILLCCKMNNIKTVVIPGLCSLSGSMPYPIVARQMRVAYQKVILKTIHYSHWREERELQSYLMCRINTLPYDLENKF